MLRRFLISILVVQAAAGVASADDPATVPAPKPTTTTKPTATKPTTKLTLAQILAKSAASAKVVMVESDRDGAEARVEEADAARLPKLKAQAYGTISPDIHCDDPLCQMTSPKNFAFRFSGLYGSAQLDVTQPLYTFGKIAHAREAARAGLAAQQALADEAAGDVAVDAARAYWGVKLARELRDMLDDGIGEIDGALKTMKEDGGKTISIQDRQRIAVLVAQAKAQRVDAAQGEANGLAGVRALVGAADADVDDDEFAPVERKLPGDADMVTAGGGRPQARAAKEGAIAADALAAAATSAYYPDLALVGSAVISRAQGVDDPPSVFANDPYNREGVGLVLGLQWTIEPWTTHARVGKARADAKKAHAQSELAAIGATFDGRTALAEATAAHDRLAATAEGEQAARTWLASVVQGEAIGVTEPKDLADAYIAWFQMRAQYATAVYAWNVSLTKLDRAVGVFKAK